MNLSATPQTVKKVSEISLKDFVKSATGCLLLPNSIGGCLPRDNFGSERLEGDSLLAKIQATRADSIDLQAE